MQSLKHANIFRQVDETMDMLGLKKDVLSRTKSFVTSESENEPTGHT
jgi:hypothetical protein